MSIRAFAFVAARDFLLRSLSCSDGGLGRANAFQAHRSAKEIAMRWRLILALLFMTAAVGPASAQPQHQGTGLSAETEDRLGNRDSGDLLWNLVGLLGLIGLIGLLPQHEEDSYHPSSFDE